MTTTQTPEMLGDLFVLQKTDGFPLMLSLDEIAWWERVSPDVTQIRTRTGDRFEVFFPWSKFLMSMEQHERNQKARRHAVARKRARKARPRYRG